MKLVKIAKMALAVALVAANLGMTAPDRAMAEAVSPPANSYSFGVEREMKESGEKGGTQASTTRDTAASEKVVHEDDNTDE